MSLSPGLNRHEEEQRANQRAWDAKPRLREVYQDFHRLIAAQINPALREPIVEIGSGIGQLKETIPTCISTDVLYYPWLDRQENAYALSFSPASISHLILFDVWHHLRFPGRALAEFHRVLVPGGRVILFEPAMSVTGRLVYGLFHHEPVAWRNEITWHAPPTFDPARERYYAAQGNATRQFWRGEARELLAGWRLCRVTPVVSFSYFASGGFSKPQFGGSGVSRLIRACDRLGSVAPRLFASRLLVVLEKTPNAAV